MTKMGIVEMQKKAFVLCHASGRFLARVAGLQKKGLPAGQIFIVITSALLLFQTWDLRDIFSQYTGNETFVQLFHLE